MADLNNTPLVMANAYNAAGKTILSGQNLVAGSVLGIVTASGAAQAYSGTGNGTMTDLAPGKGVKVGNYIVACIVAATGGGTFKVIDPDGNRFDDAVVGTAYTGPISFTINAGATDFAVGDTFIVTVTESGKLKLTDKASIDGSEYAKFILTRDIDASAADVSDVEVLKAGVVNADKLVFGGASTIDDHDKELRDVGIITINPDSSESYDNS